VKKKRDVDTERSEAEEGIIRRSTSMLIIPKMATAMDSLLDCVRHMWASFGAPTVVGF
jgi:hypothetical protein